MTSNPLLILRTLDRHLHQEVALYVYGRSALALGYPSAPEALHATMDVDAILPTRDLVVLESNDDFWKAQELTNQELGHSGLYITHLFEETQVILARGWLERVVKLTIDDLRYLQIYRPATEDLILTKMMRVDPQDRDDILFLVQQQDFNPKRLSQLLEDAVIPDIHELRDAFEQNLIWLQKTLAKA